MHSLPPSLASIPEEAPPTSEASIQSPDAPSQSAEAESRPATPHPSLHVEARQWVSTWQMLEQSFASVGGARDPVRVALRPWCIHLSKVAEQAVAMEAAGDRQGAMRVVMDFPAIFEGCQKMLGIRESGDASIFIEARTLMMERLVQGEYSARLARQPYDSDLDRCLADLCACANPHRGFRLLEEARQRLGGTGPLTEQPPRPPARPWPDAPPMRGHR